MSESIEIAFTLNGRPVTTKADPAETLLSWLRKHGIKSVKCACETTSCGLCTVLVDGSPELSCALIMPRVSGHEVLTLKAWAGSARSLQSALPQKEQTSAASAPQASRWPCLRSTARILMPPTMR